MIKIKQRYEEHWHNRFLSKESVQHEKLLPNEISESVNQILKKGKQLLDIGCGRGSFMGSTEARFDLIHGCDISEIAAREAKRKGMITICADLNNGNLPYQDNSFDSIICLEVIEHLLDPLNLLKDIYRVLQSNGQLILTTPNIRYIKNLIKLIFIGHFPHTSTDTFIWGGGHLHYFTRKDLALLFQRTGFKKMKFHINEQQFCRSYKRRFVHRIIGDHMFGELFCGGIIVEAFKE